MYRMIQAWVFKNKMKIINVVYWIYLIKRKDHKTPDSPYNNHKGAACNFLTS